MISPRTFPGKKSVREFGFHRLRHFSASHLAGKDESIKRLQGLLKQRDERTKEVYLHQVEESQKTAIERMEGFYPIGAKRGEAYKKA